MAVSDSALVTLGEAKAFIGGTIPSTEDSRVEAMIDAASELILRETSREFAPRSFVETRPVAYEGYGVLSFSPWDASTVYQVMIGDVTLVESEDYVLLPAGARDGVYTGVRFSTELVIDTKPLGVAMFDVEADWGWPAVPVQVKRACLRLVDAWYAVDGPAHGGEYGDDATDALGMVPSDVWGVINAYRRVWI